MKLYLLSSLLFLILFCAQPIENDNLYDPACNDGDYRFSAKIASGNDTVYAGVAYSAEVENEGDTKYTRFQIMSPSLTDNSSQIISGDSAGTIMFKTEGSCTLYVQARRMNGNKDTAQYRMTVRNPFRIMVDSGSYLQGEAVRFSVKSVMDGYSGDSSLRVEWSARSRKNSTSGDRPLSSPDTFYLDTLSLPDTIHISAVVKNDFNVELHPDSIVVPVVGRFKPFVSITPRILSVPVNSLAPIPVDSCRNADSLVWVSQYYHTTVVTPVTRTPRLQYTWVDAVVDTLTVTAKNRFGTIGNSDTVFVRVKFFKYGLNLDPDSFPTVIYAGVEAHWRVVATENNVIVSDTSINYAWEVDSPYVMFSARKGSLDLLFDHPIPSFHLKVTAYRGTDSSQTYPSVVTVLGHAPEISVVSVKDTVPTGEVVKFVVNAVDTVGTGFIGRVDTVFYQRLSEDTSVKVAHGDTVGLVFTEAGRQRVRFWCVDNHHFSSDTVVAWVYVRSLIPHFIDKQVDTFVYVGNAITIFATAKTERADDSIVEWRWFADSIGETPIKVTTADHFDTTFTDVGIVHFRVLCSSARGDLAQTAALRTVRVSRGLPCVDSMSLAHRDNLFINDTAKFHVAAHDSNGTLALLHVFYNADTAATFIVSSTPDVDTVVSLVLPSQPGMYALSIMAVDNENNVSAAAVLGDSISIQLGRPQVQKVTPDTSWVNDDVQYRIFAQDDNLPAGKHFTFFVRFDASGAFQSLGTDSLFRHAFTTGGVKTFECFVVDDDGVASDTAIESVYIDNGEPHITGIRTDTALSRIYVNDPVTYTLTVTDPNDSTVNVWVSWNGDTVPEIDRSEKKGTVGIAHAFTSEDTGVVTIRFRVTDPDGMRFDTSFTVTVQSGAPTVDGITLDTCSGCAYVADALPFTVSAHDTNGVLRMIYLAWNGGNTAQDSIAVSGNVKSIATGIRHTFAISQGGSRTVRAWAVDEDGVLSARIERLFSIRYGTPVVTKDTADTFWINDDNAVEITSSDTNGHIIKRWVDWNRDGVWDDSITGGRADTNSSVDTFHHAWDTTFGDQAVHYNVKVMDEDSLTGTRTCGAFLKFGRPVIRGGATYGNALAQWHFGTGGDLDTFFYARTVGQLTYLSVDTSDENGSCQRYYWHWHTDLVDDTTLLPFQSRDGLHLHDTTRVTVTCKDDDSLLSAPYTFYVFPDEPPPVTTTTTGQPGMPDVRVAWFGLDVEDDSLTQFAIVIDDSSNGVFADTVLNFTAANDNQIGKSGTFLTFTFNPQEFGTSGNFYFKVIARDARGSMPAVISPALVQYPY